jgi:hypothetical protein
MIIVSDGVLSERDPVFSKYTSMADLHGSTFRIAAMSDDPMFSLWRFRWRSVIKVMPLGFVPCCQAATSRYALFCRSVLLSAVSFRR